MWDEVVASLPNEFVIAIPLSDDYFSCSFGNGAGFVISPVRNIINIRINSGVGIPISMVKAEFPYSIRYSITMTKLFGIVTNILEKEVSGVVNDPNEVHSIINSLTQAVRLGVSTSPPGSSRHGSGLPTAVQPPSGTPSPLAYSMHQKAYKPFWVYQNPNIKVTSVSIHAKADFHSDMPPLDLHYDDLDGYFRCTKQGYWLFRAVKGDPYIDAMPMSVDEARSARPDYVLVDIPIDSERFGNVDDDINVNIDGNTLLLGIDRISRQRLVYGSVFVQPLFSWSYWYNNVMITYNISNPQVKYFYGTYHVIFISKPGEKFTVNVWIGKYVFMYDVEANIPTSINAVTEAPVLDL